MPLCSHVALHLLQLLSTQEPRWDLPALAFLVEVLECLDLSECGDSILEILSRHLRSNSRERRRLALRGLVVLSKDPSLARPIRSLSRSILKLLGDTDGEVIGMSLSVFINMFQKKHLMISSTAAPKLAEPLLSLLENDNSHVQLLSIHLFCTVMDLVVDEGKKALERIVSQSLLPLFLHCHDENQHVAKVRFCVMLLDPWEGAQLPLLWHLPSSCLLQALAQGRGSCALNCGDISTSLLLSRPLGKRCFVWPGS
ncbi:PREDICTED: uncharacterized protein LOC101808449 isoform X3 [Ficedula albicollis]|uniref:uncharacterized protein LOC101808449 isoform X3 n=1 Tax=Ficedula albicollis TaxID=59894 RepID=UPI0003596D36|nr:PREDICTED: uncharacterized protein LOC101808449 isoform X3 [Ficedula albicollis]